MREIKFRAWDKRNKIMHLDFEFIKSGNEGNDWIIFKSDKQTLEDEKVFNNPYSQQQFKIMQYTGLKDKNGVEIYEVDLLRYNDNYFKIEYDNGAFWGIPYKCTRSDIKMAKHPLGQILHYVFDDTICEVIGNIYENKDLLCE